jgi:L-amino acid N-acyltransferase YncA
MDDMHTLRTMNDADLPAVLSIYQQGIDGGDATFETAPPTPEEFNASRVEEHRIVAVSDSGRVVGWAAVSPASYRAAYGGVVEHSVYVDAAARGQEIGRALLRALIESTEASGIWTLQGVVFPENTASLALHAELGFQVVGRRERIAAPLTGPRAGRWRDTILIERRSPLI